ncbi:L-type lectin-domain containing receptor kinase IX.1-like [Syzygium oleosum]|uniref:L-type lectin-domain containing receptor kinase IX.1-like n=1 Tax=Syzygium oleosum TaxID=219896 RepID=UPI0024B9428E|nr:L-type lectin-domain containing receptor kinase IX.1-like [Syzygium oleosum]
MFAGGCGVGDADFIGAVSLLFIKHYYQISFEQLLLLGCSAVLVVIDIASQGDKCKVPPPPRRSNGMPVGNNAPTTTGRGGEEGNHSAILTEELANLGGPKKLSYGELTIATNFLASDQKLGGGDSGVVKKGYIGTARTPVAVKKITSGARQGKTEYESVVKSLSQLRHKNVVQLIGYYHEANNLVLVYKFMRQGSLERHLFKDWPVLGWITRYDIALGLASALHYLQKQCCQCVIHRDIKSSNVMLDEDFVAKLGDFGMEPGEEPSTKERDPQNLVEWVWKQYGPRKLLHEVDKRLGKDFAKKQAEALMIAELWCVLIPLTLAFRLKQQWTF